VRTRLTSRRLPERWEIRDGGKQVPDTVARRVFEEDREELKTFIHDMYHAYLSFALRRNYLNFSFLQLFAFVLLCEDHELREELGYEYVMVDEFQDSSEIQFKLTLLLAGTNNICVVGDWKQSIYSFQYADVDNIREFETRLERFTTELNNDYDRIQYPTTPVTKLELDTNYRSTQSVLTSPSMRSRHQRQALNQSMSTPFERKSRRSLQMLTTTTASSRRYAATKNTKQFSRKSMRSLGTSPMRLRKMANFVHLRTVI